MEKNRSICPSPDFYRKKSIMENNGPPPRNYGKKKGFGSLPGYF